MKTWSVRAVVALSLIVSPSVQAQPSSEWVDLRANAVSGKTGAALDLALALFNGTSPQGRDPASARIWLEVAIDAGDPHAYFIRALLHRIGVSYFLSDQEYQRWLALAALRGHLEAARIQRTGEAPIVSNWLDLSGGPLGVHAPMDGFWTSEPQGLSGPVASPTPDWSSRIDFVRRATVDTDSDLSSLRAELVFLGRWLCPFYAEGLFNRPRREGGPPATIIGDVDKGEWVRLLRVDGAWAEVIKQQAPFQKGWVALASLVNDMVVAGLPLHGMTWDNVSARLPGFGFTLEPSLSTAQSLVFRAPHTHPYVRLARFEFTSADPHRAIPALRALTYELREHHDELALREVLQRQYQPSGERCWTQGVSQACLYARDGAPALIYRVIGGLVDWHRPDRHNADNRHQSALDLDDEEDLLLRHRFRAN